MEIILHRTMVHCETTDGYITIDGNKICDTAEYTPVMLKSGLYPLKLRHLYFAAGNGVYDLRKPTIIVGTHRARGLVVHSRSAYERLYERLRKAFSRKTKVVLRVV